jgi:hypothetical protein
VRCDVAAVIGKVWLVLCCSFQCSACGRLPLCLMFLPLSCNCPATQCFTPTPNPSTETHHGSALLDPTRAACAACVVRKQLVQLRQTITPTAGRNSLCLDHLLCHLPFLVPLTSCECCILLHCLCNLRFLQLFIQLPFSSLPVQCSYPGCCACLPQCCCVLRLIAWVQRVLVSTTDLSCET